MITMAVAARSQDPLAANGWEGGWAGSSRGADNARFDPRDDLLELVRHGEKRGIDPGSSDPSDVYQDLLARERRVLDTIDRVVNDASRNDGDNRGFLQLPLHEIGIRGIRVMRGLMDDLVESRSFSDVCKAIMRPGRKVYIGVILLLLALCVYFVDVSGTTA